MSQDQSLCKTQVSCLLVHFALWDLKWAKCFSEFCTSWPSPFLVFKVQRHRAWWQTPIILSLWKAEAGRSWVWGQHGLHREFKTSLGNIVSSKLILATQLSQNQNQINETHNFNPDSFSELLLPESLLLLPSEDLNMAVHYPYFSDTSIFGTAFLYA